MTVTATTQPQPSQLEQLEQLEEPAPRHALRRNFLGRPAAGRVSVNTLRVRYQMIERR